MLSKRLVIVAALLALTGCGGGGVQSVPGGGDGPTYTPMVSQDGITLGILKDASGVPTGVRISWTRVNVSGVQGYYIYRATTSGALPDGDPSAYSANRIPDEDADGNSMIEQFGSGTDTLTFDNHFSPAVNDVYYYRMTVVNATSDESDFSTQLSITIAQHTITSITTTPVSIGSTVTITGTYFGQDRSSDQVFFTNHGGSTTVEAASYVSWGPTQIQVTVPYGAADGVLGVKVGSATVYSTDNIAFKEPSLTSLSPTEDWVQHNEITLSGADFGPAPGSGGTDSFVYFAATPCQSADIISWNTTEIKVKVPAAATGLTVNVTVDVADNVSGAQSFIILPHTDSHTPTSGTIGTSVTLTGTNYGGTQGTATVNGVSASITSWSNTQVVLTIPNAAVDGNIVLTRSDAKTTNGVGFDVVPTISSITPLRRKAGEALTINGSGFGDSRGASTVHFNGGSGIDAATYSSWANNQIVVVVPAGAVSGTVTVHISDNSVGSDQDSVTSSSPLAVILPAPDITDIGQL